jgi:hypothetical protein
VAGALGALVIGCGGGGETKTVTVPADEPAPEAGAEETATPSATPGAAPAIAQSSGTAEGDTVTFVLTELRRSGPTVIMNARIENPEGRAQLASAFSDGIDQEIEQEGREGVDVFDGVALVDPEGRKKYLVARDETGRCVCTNGLNSQFASAEAPIQLSATLTAPPATVTQVDLLIPHFETLRDVPIAE